MLKKDMPVLVYTYKDEDEKSEIDRNNLRNIMSTGEDKAFYLLNILFNIQNKIRDNQETLIVIDDIADSFDYKNKYAIIQYLVDIAQHQKFHLLILTHNFDFFRTIRLRGIANRKNCYFTCKQNGIIKLLDAQNIKNNPLSELSKKIDTPTKLIVTIPFIRNIVEYTRSTKDKDGYYKKLSTLIHWRNNTDGITMEELREIIIKILPNTEVSLSKLNINDSDKVIYKIFQEADNHQKSNDEPELYHKVVLAMSIRLKTERFIKLELDKKIAVSYNDNSITSELIQCYKKKFCNQSEYIENTIKILDRVNIMTPDTIHLNSFMYEPIIDMNNEELEELYEAVSNLHS